MKFSPFCFHRGLILAFSTIALITILTPITAISGTPHLIYGRVYNSDGNIPEQGALGICVYASDRPTEVLCDAAVGCGYALYADGGWWWLEIGNFPTLWLMDEDVRVVLVDTLRGETGEVTIVLDSSGAQHVADLTLVPGDQLGPLTYNVQVDGASPASVPEGRAKVLLAAEIDDSLTGNNNISGAEYFFDSDPGEGFGSMMQPEDGSFDNPKETASVFMNSSSWRQGSTYTVFVRGRDIAGNWGPPHRVVVTVTESEVIEVSIHIKPEGYPNPINPKSRGKIPVAILSHRGFNAVSVVDITSLTFGRTGDEKSLAFCNAGGEDVNGDGYPDLVCHFATQMTGFICGDTEGKLKGRKRDGIPIKGKDSVKIVPCK